MAIGALLGTATDIVRRVVSKVKENKASGERGTTGLFNAALGINRGTTSGGKRETLIPDGGNAALGAIGMGDPLSGGDPMSLTKKAQIEKQKKIMTYGGIAALVLVLYLFMGKKKGGY